MCKECGCGNSGEHQHEAHGDHHGHSQATEHSGQSQSPHFHGAASSSETTRQTLTLNAPVLEKNDRQAERNRGFFRARGLLTINVLSSPGSGKTTLLVETIRALAGRLRAAVVVGDLATDNDAQRLRTTGAEVVQVTTGTVCHLEAEMLARAIGDMTLDSAELLIVENVGNLVCPASYDLGEDLRVVLFSVTEGEDKPLKYPPMFQSADVVLITKTDLATACEWNRDAALENLRKAAPKAAVFELSAKKGQGIATWCDYLMARAQEREDAGLA